MALGTELATVFRFGAFELDPQASELRHKGVRIKVQDQPLQILAVLLRQPGELVTREELRYEIWSSDTFVDFDNSLNSAVNKLREALGDSRDNPRFIETVPRRGYRFIAPVKNNGQSVLATGVLKESRTQRRNLTMPLSLVLIVGFLAGGLIWRSRLPRNFTTRSAIVIGDFANSTGDAVFDGTLRQGLSVQLEQSPFLQLVSEEQIYHTLRMMGQKPTVQLTPEIAREVCQRANGAATLEGSIARVGTRYDLILRAVGCANGDSLASAETNVSDKSDVLDALGRLASEMRTKLGESLGSVQKYNTSLEQATTPSLEALKSYTLGTHAQMQSGDFAASLLFFQRAVELDPNFAVAYWAIGDAYSFLGETESAAEYMRKAFDLRAGISEPEKLGIEGDYYYYATGDIRKAQRSYALLVKIDPRDAYAHTLLADFANILGQYETGLDECRESLHIYPFNAVAFRHIVLTYLLLNRVEEAEAAAREAQANGFTSGLAAVLYGLTFYRNDFPEMARQVAATAGKPGEEDQLLALEADTAAYFGHLQDARMYSRRAADSANRADEQEAAEGYYAVSAVREALLGNTRQARQQAITAMRNSSGRDMDYGIALALAYAGDTKRAQALADDLEKRFPASTVVRFNYLPTLRAKLALNRSQPGPALDALASATPYELGLPAYSAYNWPNLYPVYARGEAYLAAHRGGDASVEFQKILDHRGIVLNEPIGALAHLQIGRAYVMAGDTSKAKAAYQDFLTLWKDADPDIPILKQAKAEYAKLQ
jgi:eukaryotic-like serine/threonine-protein kinase